jgi:hypothetical protein
MTSLGAPEPTPPGEAAAHLDDDAECLEDPVHCGDARHQHEVHLRTGSAGADDPAPADPPTPS